MSDSFVQGFKDFIRERVSRAILDLGPNPTREQIHATCVEVLTNPIKPEVEDAWMDPDGTVHFTIKWF